MRRRIVAGALVLAAAVGVTVWLLTRSSTPKQAEFRLPQDALAAVCGARASALRGVPNIDSSDGVNADGNYSGQAVLLTGKFTMIWSPRDLGPGEVGINNPSVAQLETTPSGKYRVDTCHYRP